MATISLKCACGEVQGEAVGVTPSSGIRVICCCDDCQEFASYLSRDAGSVNDGTCETLDKCGGTEIFQMSQSQVSISQGHDKLQSMRLKRKGLLRWYATCCNTPVANTISAKIPFVGVIHTFIDLPDKEAVLGPVKAVVQTQHAVGEPDYPNHSAKFPLGITLKIVMKMLLWKIQGKQKPSVFFSEDGQSITQAIILNEPDKDSTS